MADTTDNISMGNFSIQDTMEMGMGNQELLNDLFEPETASSNPEDVTAIIKEANPPAAPVAPEKPKGKTITPLEDDADDNEKNQASIANFLGDNDDDDDEEEETKNVSTKATPKAETNEDDDDDSSNTTQFTALANDLFKLGVFNEDEDDEPISTPEQFLQKFEAEKKRGASEIVQNFIGQFGEDYQNAFEAIFVKGADPKEYFSTYNNVVGFAEMDLSQENNQIAIMKQALADQGFDAEDIDTEVERLQNYGDLESVAAKHHKVLVKKEAQKLNQLEAQAQRELQQKQAIKNQYINNVQGILEDR